MTESIQGRIEHVTFYNPENGYTIARVMPEGSQETVTAVGPMCSPLPGEILRLEGEWIHHRVYGRQFKVVSFSPLTPATIEGIERYLASGLIRGLGPEMAARIVGRFGARTLDILEYEPQRLLEVEGIGPKRLALIDGAWRDTRQIRSVMIFLQGCGVSPAYAVKIYRQYGSNAVFLVQENPYRLAMEVEGIGFITADTIASQLGFKRDSPQRTQAGILYVLQRLGVDGHVYYPYDALLERCTELLQVDGDLVGQAMAELAACGRIVIDASGPRRGAGDVYLTGHYVCETGAAHRLGMLVTTPKALPLREVDESIARVQARTAVQLAASQREAIRAALEHGVCVITGGPGTGKTTITSFILQICRMQHLRVQLAAPTGRAAKRLSEATHSEAKTLHRLLEYSMAEGFQRHEENPLACDLLIVDEASMIDAVLMYHLLKAIPAEARLVLVGDVDQLPSVGPGSVLGDIISSGVVPVVKLEEIFRQETTSQIIVNAHRINHGIVPDPAGSEVSSDFFFIRREEPAQVLQLVLEMVSCKIPAAFGFDPIDEIQVITPMHKGEVGVVNLNARLQEILNPDPESIVLNKRTFRLHDKVMQLKNDYVREVYNGDIGRVVGIDRENQTLMVAFDGREVAYEFGDLEALTLAYAITVHKSQGSEYPAVVMPLLTQHYMLLQRNLVYTGVTRGTRLVVMVGSSRALAMAVHNDKTQRRFTRLKERLVSELDSVDPECP